MWRDHTSRFHEGILLEQLLNTIVNNILSRSLVPSLKTDNIFWVLKHISISFSLNHGTSYPCIWRKYPYSIRKLSEKRLIGTQEWIWFKRAPFVDYKSSSLANSLTSRGDGMLSVILNYNLFSKLAAHRYKESSIIWYYESKILIRDLSLNDCLYSSQ